MSNQVADHTELPAPVGAVLEVVTDFASYLQWRPGLSSVEVLDHDERGRATRVRFGAHIGPVPSHYTVVHRYPEPVGGTVVISWTLADADVLARYDGTWTLRPTTPGSTRVDHAMTVVPSMPAPGFVVRQATRHDLRATLDALRHRVAARGRH